MKVLPSTIRGQVILAFSACFLFMALMIGINYWNGHRLSESMLVLLILLGSVVFFIGEKIVRPLARITRESEAIARGDFQGLISPFGGPNNEIYSLIVALNRMMTELESRKEQLVQSGKIAAVGSLTSGIAHKLNNPINNIVLTLETLVEDNQTMPPEERLQLYQEALDQADRAADIVKNLLEFSRANHPRSEKRPAK